MQGSNSLVCSTKSVCLWPSSVPGWGRGGEKKPHSEGTTQRCPGHDVDVAPLVPGHLMHVPTAASHLPIPHCHLPALASSQPGTRWGNTHMCVRGASVGETSRPPRLMKRDQEPCAQPGCCSTPSRFPAPSTQALGSSNTHSRLWQPGPGLGWCAGCRDGDAFVGPLGQLRPCAADEQLGPLSGQKCWVFSLTPQAESTGQSGY